MYYIVDTEKAFAQAAADLEASVARNGFGILHVHDLGSTLRSKGVEFGEECKVFEVCNPRQQQSHEQHPHRYCNPRPRKRQPEQCSGKSLAVQRAQPGLPCSLSDAA